MPAYPRASVTALWQAPDGVLFVGGPTETGGGEVWRCEGGRCALDVSLPAAPERLRGVTSAGYYAQAGGRIYARTGGTLVELDRPSVRLSSTQLRSFAVYGTSGVLVSFRGDGFGAIAEVFEREGAGPWRQVPFVSAGDFPELHQLGPATSPAVLVSAYAGNHMRTAAGWREWTSPPGVSVMPGTNLLSSDAALFIAQTAVSDSGFARTDGTAPWQPRVDWLTHGSVPRWTDGRFVIASRPSGGLIRCDLGPWATP
jgi:hypothetical protein